MKKNVFTFGSRDRILYVGLALIRSEINEKEPRDSKQKFTTNLKILVLSGTGQKRLSLVLIIVFHKQFGFITIGNTIVKTNNNLYLY